MEVGKSGREHEKRTGRRAGEGGKGRVYRWMRVMVEEKGTGWGNNNIYPQ